MTYNESEVFLRFCLSPLLICNLSLGAGKCMRNKVVSEAFFSATTVKAVVQANKFTDAYIQTQLSFLVCESRKLFFLLFLITVFNLKVAMCSKYRGKKNELSSILLCFS